MDVDHIAENLIALLEAEGAARIPHGGGRVLLDHLVGTYEVVRRWEQPEWLQHAALIHSAYGTDVYHRALLAVSRRCDVARVAGDRAERLAYLFCLTPRDLLFAGTHRWARAESLLPPSADGQPPPSRAELDELVLLHIANFAEQARAGDGSPGRWLVRVRELAQLLTDGEGVTVPPFFAELAPFSDGDESLAGRAYRDALARTDCLEASATRLALAGVTCPVVAEPCIWQAHLSRCRGDLSAAQSWARAARRRLLRLGTAWDKRLTFDEWLKLTELLQRPAERETPPAISDPRSLYDALLGAPAGVSAQDLETSPARQIQSPDTAAAETRFHRYVEALAERDDASVRGVYPDLDSQPWFDPSDFPLARYLESHFDAVRAEILALDASRFHRESERIKRSGDWDVAFFYERGRRRDEVCDACPVTTRGIESQPAMRTVAGLIYASRMRPGTHIEAHRGPTNIRLRCHLGVRVPDGDCGIRVGDEIRQWREGRCLVFDDFFEHEAWNHTDEDRLVLIVDLWHPGLSGSEVRLLEGLQSYAYAYARRLNRYWSANAAAAATATGG